MAQSQLSRHLRLGEKVLWVGKPVKAPFIFPSFATLIIGFIWLASFSLWLSFALSTRPPAPFIFFALFPIFMGVGIIVGPVVFGLLRYGNTEYMITDQRIIAQTGAIGLDTRFVDLSKIQEVYVSVGLIDKIFGTGSIIVSTAGFVPVDTPIKGEMVRPALKAIRNPYEVQKLLQEAIKKA